MPFRLADVESEFGFLPVSVLPSRCPPFHEPGIVPIDLRRAPAAAGLWSCQRWLSRGYGLGSPRYLSHLLGLPQPVLGGLAAEDGLVALFRRRQTQEALGFQILPGRRQLLLDLPLRGRDALNRLISGEALVTQLCLEIVDRVSRFGQQSFRFVACGGLRLQGLPGGVQPD